MVETFASEIRAFIVSNFLFGQEGKGFADDLQGACVGGCH